MYCIRNGVPVMGISDRKIPHTMPADVEGTFSIFKQVNIYGYM
jgi:hypothetical protein